MYVRICVYMYHIYVCILFVGKLPPVEYTVFKESYVSLKNILSAQNLSVSADVISFQDEVEICTAKTSFAKSTILLQQLVGPLESGNTYGFYQLLQVMEEHGNIATKDLAAKMKSRVSSLGGGPTQSSSVTREPTHSQSATVSYQSSSLPQGTDTMSSVSPALKPSGITDDSDGVEIIDLKGISKKYIYTLELATSSFHIAIPYLGYYNILQVLIFYMMWPTCECLQYQSLKHINH